MRDPTRWRDAGSGADDETRALLEAAQAGGPSRTQKDRMWSALAPQLPALPPPPATPIGPATAGTGALVGKIAVGVVLVAAVGAGVGISTTHRREHPTRPLLAPQPASPRALPPETAPEPQVAPALAPPPATVEKAARPRPRSPAPAALKPPQPPVAEPPSAPSAEAATNQLLEEGRRLTRARAALRDHDPEHALALLRMGGSGTAALAQEREALTVEALAGRPATRAQAAELAQHFLRTYPDSPYRARIKVIVFDGP
jgi:hypothetical protein